MRVVVYLYHNHIWGCRWLTIYNTYKLSNVSAGMGIQMHIYIIIQKSNIFIPPTTNRVTPGHRHGFISIGSISISNSRFYSYHSKEKLPEDARSYMYTDLSHTPGCTAIISITPTHWQRNCNQLLQALMKCINNRLIRNQRIESIVKSAKWTHAVPKSYGKVQNVLKHHILFTTQSCQ